MPDIQGRITNLFMTGSAGVNVNFFTASNGSQTYTTTTDANGYYTQSVAAGWSGSLNPTSSNYNFYFTASSPSYFYYSVPKVIPSVAANISQDLLSELKWSSGAGTSASPWVIVNAENLTNMRLHTSSVYYYELGANIDLNGVTNWEPIPCESGSAFYGYFDGKNYTISNLNIISRTNPDVVTSTRFYGLFGQLIPETNTTPYKDVKMLSCSISLQKQFSQGGNSFRSVGTFAGYINPGASYVGTVKNIHIINAYIDVYHSGSGAGNTQYAVGGCVGNVNNPAVGQILYKECSVEDSYLRLWQSGSLISNAIGIGGVFGMGGGAQASYIRCWSKNNTIIGNRNNSQVFNGGLAAGSGITATDCYVLSCSLDNNATANGFCNGMLTGGRNYVAKLYFEPSTPVSARNLFLPAGFTEPPAGYLQYIETHSNNNGFLPVYSAVKSVADMKDISTWTGSYGDSKVLNFVEKWDHDTIADRIETTQFTMTSAPKSESYSSRNFRNLVTGSLVTGNSTYVRVVLRSNPYQAWSFTQVSIMEFDPAGGDPWDGKNPVRLYFSESASGSVSAGQDLISDAAKFPMVAGTDYFVHIVKGSTAYNIPTVNLGYNASYHRAASTDYSLTPGYTTSILTFTSSYGFSNVIGINLITESRA